MIDTYVIAADQDSERFRRFARLNRHLKFKVFPAADGTKLSDAEAVSGGFLTQDCADSGKVTKGALGRAISHWTLWWQAVRQKTSILVVEEDTATHPDIQTWIDQAQIADDTDIIYFGIDTDALLETITPEGVHQISVFGESHPDYASISRKLSLTRISDVRLWTMLKGFGNCCYLVTPRGADKLVQKVLPLRLDSVPVPLLDQVSGTRIDRRMNALFAELEAFVSIPFLAWTPNMDSTARG